MQLNMFLLHKQGEASCSRNMAKKMEGKQTCLFLLFYTKVNSEEKIFTELWGYKELLSMTLDRNYTKAIFGYISY